MPVPELSMLQRLDEMYPERAPNPNDPERIMWMKAGHREVINFLWSVFNEAQENVLRR